MTSLEKLIKEGKIEFLNRSRRIDTNIGEFGEYNWDLVAHIKKNSGTFITISGAAIEEHLTEVKNLFYLTDFMVQLYSGKKDIRIHVEADIEKIDQHYTRPKEEVLYNGLGTKVCESTDWMPELPYFEKMWNFALCDAIGGFVGYPGYEHPSDEETFRYVVEEHAQNFMIGTKKQLDRYIPYAESFLRIGEEELDPVGNEPTLLQDPYRCQRIIINISAVKMIIENIEHFQWDDEKID